MILRKKKERERQRTDRRSSRRVERLERVGHTLRVSVRYSRLKGEIVRMKGVRFVQMSYERHPLSSCH